MPMVFFLNFFKNHGLFKLKNRPQWYTVSNRSKTYVNKILSSISGEYFKNYEINKVIRENNLSKSLLWI
jgi:predicted NAD/FAD-binding protein